MNYLDNKKLKDIIRRSLKEDIGKLDITSKLLIPKNASTRARFVAKEEGIICGLKLAKEIFLAKDKNIKFIFKRKDGDFIKKNTILAEIKGNSRAILAAERTALNFMSHLSGISTKTNSFVKKIKPFKTKIMDTRKTKPGLRLLEKYAVRCGGGSNHRFSLEEHILIKDNHIEAAGCNVNIKRLKSLIEDIKLRKHNLMKLEVEVETIAQFKAALIAKPDIIMLDNMSIADIKKAVKLKKEHPHLIEVSGNVKLNNVRSIAKTGVDMISIGELTNSVNALDISLEFLQKNKSTLKQIH